MTLVLGTMAPFLRIAFKSYELGALPPLADPPFCAIKMKEALTTGEKHFTALSFTEVVISVDKTVTSFLWFPVLKNIFITLWPFFLS